MTHGEPKISAEPTHLPAQIFFFFFFLKKKKGLHLVNEQISQTIDLIDRETFFTALTQSVA